MIATSAAPKSTPTATNTITSVCIAGARSAPPRCLATSRAGFHSREGACAANATVPANSTMPANASATPVEKSAPTPSTIGGPAIQVNSTAEASTA